ncbi:signal peptidase I [bacterium]|nr:signal peptidase I [bacterium]
MPLNKEVFIRRGKNVKEVISTIIFVIVALIIIRFFIFEVRWIPSASMKPTFIEGDRVIVDRYSRFYSTPKRGDIMIFYPPEVELKNTFGKVFSRLTGFFCKDTAYIKRVIGLPGDKFEIKIDNNGIGMVYINDIPLAEPYIKSPLEYPVCSPNMMCGPFIIPENKYFMMGDNRGNSRDSRYWGFLDKDRFIGKAVFVIRFARTNRDLK